MGTFLNSIKSKFGTKESSDLNQPELEPKPARSQGKIAVSTRKRSPGEIKDEPGDLLENLIEKIGEPHNVYVPETPRNLRTFLAKYTRIKYKHVKIFLAEMLGEIIYITVGLSSIAQYKFQVLESPYLSDPLGLYFGYTVGLIFAILIVGKISGPNISTAITFARLLVGDIGFGTFFVYAGAQFLGAFIGAVFVYIIYLEPISKHPSGMHSLATAGIFSTYPNGVLTYFEDFFIQCVATAVLIMLFLALTDKKNHQVSHGFIALFIGLAIMMKTCAFSLSLSNSINPARDFAPRLFTYIAGWGPQVWSNDNYFFWIPLVAPFVGSLFGTLIYLILISSQIDST